MPSKMESVKEQEAPSKSNETSKLQLPKKSDEEQRKSKILSNTDETTKLQMKKERFSEAKKKRTERIPIQVLMGKKYKLEEDTRKKKYKEKMKSKRDQLDNLMSHLESPNLSSAQTPEEDGRWSGKQSKMITFTVKREMNVRPNKYTANLPNRSIKMTKNMERPFLIMEDTIDYTPKRVVKPGDSRWLTNPLLFSFPCEKLTHYKPEDLLINYGKSSSKAVLDYSKQSRFARHDSDDKVVTTPITGSDNETSLSEVPSMYFVVYPEPPLINKRKISFKLSETELIILLDMKSRASELFDAEGIAIEKNNKFQLELKQRLRKTIENYSQTSMVNESNRVKETQISRQQRANKYCFTSNWVYYDTKLQVEAQPPEVVKKKTVGKVDVIIYAEVKSEYEPLIGNNFKIVDRLNWFRVGMVMERVLLSNNAMDRQLVFHDHLKSNPMSEVVSIEYRLERLWTLKNDDTKGRTVTSISWNIHEKNLLAIGYGKYSYSDKNKGLVLIWNNKNVANPEREYFFEHPVTSLQFSDRYPAILAISFYTGMVMIINIIKHHGIKIVAQNMPSNRSLLHPVWKVRWLSRKNDESIQPKDRERIVECRGDGCVFKYTRAHLYEKKLIMTISKIKGVARGINHLKRCEPHVIPLVRHPAVLCIALHPDNPDIYLIGSDEGAVYKCTLQDVNQHTEMFLAHNGPVYVIEFHPACTKIFLTCGADWYIRVWGDGITVPLLTMISGMSAVYSACWCPNNPTVIASITTKKIHLWDISSRINLPQATIENPFGCLNTSMTFSRCGSNLCVGDDDGNVFVYALSEMPFEPKIQSMILALALLKALVPQPKLVIELRKLGEPFLVERIYRNLINLPF